MLDSVKFVKNPTRFGKKLVPLLTLISLKISKSLIDGRQSMTFDPLRITSVGLRHWVLTVQCQRKEFFFKL